ncbi:PLP-dependent aminotransferase family protein [Rhodococcus rhodochrous]|uniref:GntR family transcriptional regulator n=1 Tax=Rhodococcus rhodochrous KG-21 TaxID=1441923 RepID=A0A0M8PN59_RHORH|nr:PLP-dependent aminotransferase family protein [Rhodococcus rhodochrous]KOS55128.1 GntR family transcriptional regulator [Rhodococcus rhodochrous KG-21]
MPRVAPAVHPAFDLPDTDAPLRQRVAEAVVDQIRQGRIGVGDPLPSTRVLAAELGVSRGCVVDAYDELCASGFAVARAGSGTRVAPGADVAARAHAASHPVVPAAAVTEPDPARRAPVLDLRPGIPDPALISEPEWRRAWRAAAAAPRALGVADPEAHPDLRRALADHLRRTRGLACGADEIVVLPGVAAAIRVLAIAARLRDRDVAFEDPGYLRARRALVGEGARPRPIPVGTDGLDPDTVRETDAAVYCTPAHQYPMGARMPVSHRARLVARAADMGTIVVEDDYDGEFRYDVSALPALRSIDGGRECVAYVGTASKILSPDLRLAWLIPSTPLRSRIAAAVAESGEVACSVTASALARLIESGALSRHLARASRTYRARRAAFVGALGDLERSDVTVTGIEAGLHVVLRFPEGVDDVAIAEAARRLGVETAPLSRYSAGPGGPSGLVCGYARLPESRAAAAAAAIGATLPGGVPFGLP